MVSSGPGSLSVYSQSTDEFNILTTTVDPDVLQSYLEYYQHISPFRGPIARLKPGEHFSRRAFLDDDSYLKSRYYNEFSKAQDVFEVEHHALSEVNGMIGGLSLTRPKHRPDFSAEERRFIATSVPHLRRALSNYLTLLNLRNENRIYNEILESTACTVLVLDTSLRIIYANGVGENELNKEQLIRRTRSGKISLRSNSAMRRLRDISDQIRNGLILDKNVPKYLKIGKQADGSDVWINVAVGGHLVSDGVEDTRSIVLSASKPLTRSNSIMSLASRYGLTPAETGVVELLSLGHNVRSICSKLSISENTVRTHLKHAFAKTKTDRQADLVRLILS